MLHHLGWLCWIGGAVLIAASQLSLVSAELGWTGFYVTLGAAVLSYLPRRDAQTPTKTVDWAILTKAMLEAKDHGYDSAINRLQMGDTVLYDGLAFALRPGNALRLASAVSLPPGEMDEIRALRDAEQARTAFEALARSSPEIAALASDKQIHVSLLSELGGGGVEVCRVTDGQVDWPSKR